jgi:REP-associated tyrosine transposase
MTDAARRDEQRLLRKRIRLPVGVYSEPGTRALVTIATLDRHRVFDDAVSTTECVNQLRAQASEQAIAVLAYCFMPDHLHLLLRVDGGTGIIDFVGKFKSLTTRYWWTRGNLGRLWQRTFHDHLLRDAEDEAEHLKYVLANPVRAGIVDEWPQYRFAGSLEYDLVDGELT